MESVIKTESPSALWEDYELVDCGGFEKLERFGKYFIRRPEPKALWDKTMSEKEWERACHTRFRPGAGFGKTGKEDSGTWEFTRKMEQQWVIGYSGGQAGGNGSGQDGGNGRDGDNGRSNSRGGDNGQGGDSQNRKGDDRDSSGGGLSFKLRLGLTSFKHVGVFPEQAPNWDWIYSRTAEHKGEHPARILNLFAYTGAASLAAKAAGADVTHLDAVRQVVTWARENMELSGMDGLRWVVEDAMKFAAREERRGRLYDGIILDPPAYGHGPDGERWKLDECIFEMLRSVSRILAPENSFLVLNLYSNGYTAPLAETLVRETFGRVRTRECGELVLRDRSGKALPLSVFTRITR